MCANASGQTRWQVVPSMQEGMCLQSGTFAEMNELHYTLRYYFSLHYSAVGREIESFVMQEVNVGSVAD